MNLLKYNFLKLLLLLHYISHTVAIFRISHELGRDVLIFYFYSVNSCTGTCSREAEEGGNGRDIPITAANIM